MKPLHFLKESVDKNAARHLASDIAKLIGSRVVANSKIVMGERFCPYKVPYHTAAFFCSIFVSDTSYSLRAKHRKETRAIADCAEFCISLKHPVSHMGLRKQLGTVSHALGIDVFTQIWTPEAEVEPRLMQDQILAALRQLDCDAFDQLFVSQMQLSTKGTIRSAQHCSEQVRRMRQLFEMIFKDAWSRRASA